MFTAEKIAAAIKTAKDDLMKSLQDIGAKMYQQAAQAQQAAGGQPGDPSQGGPQGPQNGADGNVYDADYKDVD